MALACDTPDAFCAHIRFSCVGHVDCASRRIPCSSAAPSMGRTAHFLVDHFYIYPILALDINVAYVYSKNNLHRDPVIFCCVRDFHLLKTAEWHLFTCKITII